MGPALTWWLQGWVVRAARTILGSDSELAGFSGTFLEEKPHMYRQGCGTLLFEEAWALSANCVCVCMCICVCACVCCVGVCACVCCVGACPCRCVDVCECV